MELKNRIKKILSDKFDLGSPYYPPFEEAVDALLNLVEEEKKKVDELWELSDTLKNKTIADLEASHQATIKELRDMIEKDKDQIKVEMQIALLAKLNEIGGKDDN